MGASSWRYYTPHRANPEEALQELRRDVFARGEYSYGFGGFARADGPMPDVGDLPRNFGQLPNPLMQFFHFAAEQPGEEGRITRAAMSGDYTGLSTEERQAAEQMRPLFQLGNLGRQGEEDVEDDDGEGGGFPFNRRPESIEELLEMVAEDGTHSILDIEHTDRRLGFGVAAPMPPLLLRRFFESEQPTRERVEEHWGDASEELERWQAYYFTVYRDGRPHEYAFIGCSGD
jgi:hypothetical protein